MNARTLAETNAERQWRRGLMPLMWRRGFRLRSASADSLQPSAEAVSPAIGGAGGPKGPPPQRLSAGLRVGRFAGVGVLGFALQLAVLQGLTMVGLGYIVATAIAVELTILHNFVWHERYTWGDAGSRGDKQRAARLVRFNASTAIVSVGGNVMLTWLFVLALHFPLIVANASAVCVLSALNYVVADRWVFRIRAV